MTNKESLTEDISNILLGNPEDKDNETSLVPNDRVVNELMELFAKYVQATETPTLLLNDNPYIGFK